MHSAFAEARRRGEKLVIGVVHLRPLPGSPRFSSRAEIDDAAKRDAAALMEGGAHGFIVENFGDVPFHRGPVPAATTAEMSVIVERLRTQVGNQACVGVNVLRNDANAALAIAAATGASFIRVNVHSGAMLTDQGLIEGAAADTLRLRRELQANVEILADVAVKHALPPPGFDLEQAAHDTHARGLADGLIVTGRGTGQPASRDELERLRRALPECPLFVGSGVSDESVAGLLRDADGVIVGTWLKENGDVTRAVSPSRTRRLCQAARQARA